MVNFNSEDIRKILSSNIKKHRELNNLSQEKLAEMAGISTNMIKDIEGCRSWVSDKTLAKLTVALKTDIYRLFISPSVYEEEIYRNVHNDLLQILNKIKNDVNYDFAEAFRLWQIK